MSKRKPLLLSAALLAVLLAGAFVVSGIGSQAVRAQTGTSTPAAAVTATTTPVTSTAPLTGSNAVTQPDTAIGLADVDLPHTVTVVGEGKVSIKPDLATVNVGVEVISSTVKAASAEANATMDAVITAIKAQGIADKDIQTSNYNIYIERRPVDGKTTDEIVYHVSQQVLVKIRDLTKVGPVLDASIEAGANNIYGVTFGLEDPSQVEAEARAEAVANALSKARELAALNGATIAGVVSVSEVIGNNAYVNNDFAAAAAVRGVGGGGGTPITPGELELSMSLQVVYALK